MAIVRGFFREFKKFMRDFRVITVAIGFIVAITVSKVVNSFVTDMVNPIISEAIPQESLVNSTWTVWGATLKVGSFASVLMELLIIFLIIFILVRYVLRWKPAK